MAAILAPTDAGLGQVIVNSPRVPMRIRQALNVEAGLNDGLSVPFLFFIALRQLAPRPKTRISPASLPEQLGYGVVVGTGIGLAGGWLLGFVRRRGWITHSFLQLGVVALPLLCGLASEAAAASMFIAAFVAGLAVRWASKRRARSVGEFAEEWGQLFNLAVFFLFGLLAARASSGLNLSVVLYALQPDGGGMLPVAIALIGTRLRARRCCSNGLVRSAPGSRPSSSA